MPSRPSLPPRDNPDQFALFNRFEYLRAGPSSSDPLPKMRPPADYYHQHLHAQLALPGMEMGPDEHLQALAHHLGSPTTLHNDIYSHEGVRYPLHVLTVHRGEGSKQKSFLNWWGHAGSPHDPDQGFARRFHPGEIDDIKSFERGDAHKMLAFAERLNLEHPDLYTRPRHSTSLTIQGREFALEQTRRRGEEEWMA